MSPDTRGVWFTDFRWPHALAITLQPSQWIEAGVDCSRMDEAQARALESRGAAWTAFAPDGRVLCCAGLAEVFAGRQAVAWAMLAVDLGTAAHLAITRFARAQITSSRLARIETLVAADGRGRGAKWARACGLRLNTIVERWGAASETMLLFERVR